VRKVFFKKITKEQFLKLKELEGEDLILNLINFSCPELIITYENYRKTMLETLSKNDVNKVAEILNRIYIEALNEFTE
jgi:hypothetical protein